MRGVFVDLAGRRFGALTVVRRGANSAGGQVRWECVCECKASSLVWGSSLRSGTTVSCGCSIAGRLREGALRLTHGHKKNARPSRTYSSWAAMRTRCCNPDATDYHLYGGAGITVCQRWDDFATFLFDMGERPVGKTLERRKRKLGYSPANCYWATASEQTRNRSFTVLSEARVRAIRKIGKTLTQKSLAARFGTSPATIGAVLRGEIWKDVV